MAYEAKIIEDSISPHGYRLTTVEATYPRFVHAEMMTHRVFSRNTASSRAIPVEKTLAKVLVDPVLPVYWGANRPGMQASEELETVDQEHAQDLWIESRDMAVLAVTSLVGGLSALKNENLKSLIAELDVVYNFGISKRALATPLHKQIANRLLEPYLWHTAIVTATEWDNFFALRTHPDAQPEIRQAAVLIQEARQASEPTPVEEGHYHLPFLQEDEVDLPTEDKIKICIGRCARVSYLTHSGKRDREKDIELYERLIEGGHMSPTEHVATPITSDELAGEIEWSGNFRGWHQYRKDIPNEVDFSQRS